MTSADRRRQATRGVHFGLIAAGLYALMATGIHALSGQLFEPGAAAQLAGIVAAYGIAGVLAGWAVGWNLGWARHPMGRAALGFLLSAIVFSAIGVAVFGSPLQWDETVWMSLATTTVIFGVFIGVLSRDFFT